MTLKNALVSAAGNAADRTYIEDVFSTYLYTGNSSTQTITNGIDLAGEGGLVWINGRNVATGIVNWDTTMSPYANLSTYNTDAIIDQGSPYGIASANTDGFSIGNTNWIRVNSSGYTYASWTFRKAEKFFDVVTYTGNNVAGRTIAHNLGSVPGCIIVKAINDARNWTVFHHQLDGVASNQGAVFLNTTDAITYSSTLWNNTSPTASVFTVGASGNVNSSGNTYVAYLFAHDAGGFGADGTENVISCGSYTGNGSATGPVVSLGWEPQWVLVKRTDFTSQWTLSDNMRGQPVGGATKILYTDSTDAEGSATTAVSPNADGFQVMSAGTTFNASGGTYIYIAIRRGPMKVPTSGTEVYNISSRQATAPGYVSGFPVDMYFYRRSDAATNWLLGDRLRGGNVLFTNLTDAESAAVNVKFDYMNGTDSNTGAFATLYGWMFRRAPGFFDVVCWTGDGVGTTRTLVHNLGVVPEIVIAKKRGVSSPWYTNFANYSVALNSTNAGTTPPFPTVWGDGSTYIAPTADNFTVNSDLNQAGQALVGYLFATVPGVSKVGSYTGTATTNLIDCGFSSGARFVLIKRADSTGDWYVYDSARGIVAGNDPYLLLNSTAAEVTSTDYVDTYSAGFELTSTAPAGLNASGGTYIFLAIA